MVKSEKAGIIQERLMKWFVLLELFNYSKMVMMITLSTQGY